MSNCAKCNSDSAEFFNTAGQMVCKRCFYAEDTQQREQRAAEATVEEVPERLRDAIQLQDISSKKQGKPAPPGTLLRQGITLSLVGLLLLPVTVYLEGGVMFALSAFGLGFVLTVRGYKLRHYM